MAGNAGEYPLNHPDKATVRKSASMFLNQNHPELPPTNPRLSVVY